MEITREKLSEFFCPTSDFQRFTDGTVVDYAVIEINPKGIKKLEENLERYGNSELWTEKEWTELNDSSSDVYEHVIAYVHFDAGTDHFNNLFLCVTTAYDSEELSVEDIIDDEEKQNIIEAALESLHKLRGTKKSFLCQ